MLEEKVLNGDSEVNMLDLSWRTSIEIFGQAGLGYSFDSLDESKHNVC